MAEFPKGWLTFGHDGMSRLLLGSFRAGRLSHAYVFTGPHMSGRKSLAMDLARAVNCTGPEAAMFGALGAGGADGALDARPCGECVQCRRITRGLHADVQVITPETPIPPCCLKKKSEDDDDEASARRKDIRIGHIRHLDHQASLTPFEGKTRVFIIDGAELMNVNTANALLKTLEEPPPDVLIILVAASEDAVPPTIISRCHRIDMRPVPAAVIERELVARFGAAPADAQVLARIAAGRPGWAVAALKDPSLLEKHTQGMQRVSDAVTGVLEARFRYAREVGDAFWRKRDEGLAELDLWLAWWRDLASAKLGLGASVVSVDRLAELTAYAGQLENSEIVGAIESVLSTRLALVGNASARLALEVMMLDLPRIDASKIVPVQTAIAGA